MPGTPLTQPLRDEHAELFPNIENLRQVADAVGAVPQDQLTQQVDRVWEFLDGHLVVHAKAEEAVLYPTVDRVLDGQPVTRTMSRDHVAVVSLTAELDHLRELLASNGLDDALARDLRRVLYGLYAVVSLHFQKEEEVYLPILDERLTEAEARSMFTDLHRAATELGGSRH